MASLLAFFSAAVLMAGVVYRLTMTRTLVAFIDVWGTLPFGYWAVLIFTGGYILAIYPLYRNKAIWILGMTWGTVEGVGVLEALLVFGPSSEPIGNLLWVVYFVFVVLFMGVSLFVLRRSFTTRGGGNVALLGMVIAWLPLVWFGFGILAPWWYVAIYDILGITLVLSSIKRRGDPR